MRKILLPCFIAALTALAVAGLGALIVSAAAVCSAPPIGLESEIGKAANCWEFWFSRYQTTFQTVVSSAIAGAGLYFIVHQLRGLRDQNEITRATLQNAMRESEKNWRITKEKAAYALLSYSSATSELKFIVMKHMGQPGPAPDFPPPALIEASHSTAVIAAALDSEALRTEWAQLKRKFSRLAAYVGAMASGGVATLRAHPNWSDLPANDRDWLRQADQFSSEIEKFAVRIAT